MPAGGVEAEGATTNGVTRGTLDAPRCSPQVNALTTMAATVRPEAMPMPTVPRWPMTVQTQTGTGAAWSEWPDIGRPNGGDPTSEVARNGPFGRLQSAESGRA